ncbi:hypothetical protein N7504_000676 [Penicillium tannophilum]|nr:hypothetical protein N7504_000676 [Penicillium tannophilum]
MDELGEREQKVDVRQTSRDHNGKTRGLIAVASRDPDTGRCSELVRNGSSVLVLGLGAFAP